MAFIKIDRELINSYCFANPNHLKIWIWLLIKANFKKTYAKLKVSKGYITVEVNRGQLIFGRLKASEELDISESIIRRTLDKFVELKQIKIEKTNQFSIITICKYDSYQSNILENDQPTTTQEPTNDQPTTNQQPHNDHATAIYKEGKEGKEGKEDIDINLKNNLSKSNLFKQPNIPTQEEVIFAFKSSGGTKEMAEKFFSKYSATGWFLNGSAISNFKFLIPNFIDNFKSIKNANTKLSATDKFNAYLTYADRFVEKGNEGKTP